MSAYAKEADKMEGYSGCDALGPNDVVRGPVIPSAQPRAGQDAGGGLSRPLSCSSAA